MQIAKNTKDYHICLPFSSKHRLPLYRVRFDLLSTLCKMLLTHIHWTIIIAVYVVVIVARFHIIWFELRACVCAVCAQ